MDTQQILDACGRIADELAKILESVKCEQEVRQAMGQPQPEKRTPGLNRK